MSVSRRVRHAALVALYQHDLVAAPEAESLEAAVEEVEASAKERRRGLEVALEIRESRDRFDALLAPFTSEWPLHRQPVMDRNILRLCCWEILESGTAGPIAINEAVELAKEYGTDRSAAFINGVLAALLRSIAPSDAEPASEAAAGQEG
ncbi:MAG: transcription antitermination factor NusB [Phycisphaerales bacterium]|jgi:N utilization substance protein B